MVKVTHSLVINRPAATVFEALTDFENTPKWQPQVIEEKLVSESGLGVGAVIFQARYFRGSRIESTSEIKEFELNRKMVNASDPTKSPAVQTRYDVEEFGGSSRLTFIIELKGKGFFRVIEPLVKRALLKDVHERFQTLKQQLESN